MTAFGLFIENHRWLHCPVYLTGLIGLCYIRLRCLGFALAWAVSWLESVPSAQFPISARKQMTTNINKAHVVLWKQTLSWCKQMQLLRHNKPCHLLLLRIQTIFSCQRLHYYQSEGFKCITHTTSAPPREKAES